VLAKPFPQLQPLIPLMTPATATPEATVAVEAPAPIKFARRRLRARAAFVTVKRYDDMLEQLAPGQYAITDLAERFDIPQSSFAWMLNKHPHPRFHSPRVGTGQVRTVTILNA